MAFPSLDEVVQQLQTIAEDDGIGADSKLADLDVDSLDVMEWVFEIEGQAGLEIDDSLYEKDALEKASVREFYERIKDAASA
jgi:acyl carrier protein